MKNTEIPQAAFKASIDFAKAALAALYAINFLPLLAIANYNPSFIDNFWLLGVGTVLAVLTTYLAYESQEIENHYFDCWTDKGWAERKKYKVGMLIAGFASVGSFLVAIITGL